MPFGILIHMLHALQHGTTNLLLVNLKNIVFMNQKLEHVIVFIADESLLFEVSFLIFIKTKIKLLVIVFPKKDCKILHLNYLSAIVQ